MSKSLPKRDKQDDFGSLQLAKPECILLINFYKKINRISLPLNRPSGQHTHISYQALNYFLRLRRNTHRQKVPVLTAFLLLSRDSLGHLEKIKGGLFLAPQLEDCLTGLTGSSTQAWIGHQKTKGRKNVSREPIQVEKARKKVSRKSSGTQPFEGRPFWPSVQVTWPLK